MIRYYICPVVEVEVFPGAGEFIRRPKVETYPTKSTANAISDAVWALSVVRASAAQHAVIEADPQCVDVFERLSDISGADTRQEFVAWAQSRTLGSVPSATRTRIRNRLTAVGVNVTGLTNSSTFLDVMRRVFDVHNPGQLLEDLG